MTYVFKSQYYAKTRRVSCSQMHDLEPNNNLQILNFLKGKLAHTFNEDCFL